MVAVEVRVDVKVSVGVGVVVRVLVAVFVGVGVRVNTSVRDGVAEMPKVGVSAAIVGERVMVSVMVLVLVSVSVGVGVGVSVGVGVAVSLGVRVGACVGIVVKLGVGEIKYSMISFVEHAVNISRDMARKRITMGESIPRPGCALLCRMGESVKDFGGAFSFSVLQCIDLSELFL